MALTDLLTHYLFPIALVPIVWYLSTFISSSAPTPKNRRLKKVEEEEESVVLEKILVHPIKSCRAVELQESAYTTFGLEYDRKWMIVDATTHKALTARELPQLVLISSIIDVANKVLKVTIPGSGSIDIPLDPEETKLKGWKLISDVQLWSSTMDAYILPFDQLQKNLSEYCGKDVLLIMKGPTPRHLEMQENQTIYPIPQVLPPTSQTAFADGYPFLLVSTWSIAEVEQNIISSFSGSPLWAVKPPLEGEIGEKWAKGEGDIMRRTRGNLVVGGKGGKAWDEDGWGVVRIGEGRDGKGEGEELVVVSMCGRCQLPNVDPSTGLSHLSIPYKVLSKYRRVDPVDKFSPCFGVNAAPMASRGVLRVGDKVRIVKMNEWIRREEE